MLVKKKSSITGPYQAPHLFFLCLIGCLIYISATSLITESIRTLLRLGLYLSVIILVLISTSYFTKIKINNILFIYILYSYLFFLSGIFSNQFSIGINSFVRDGFISLLFYIACINLSKETILKSLIFLSKIIFIGIIISYLDYFGLINLTRYQASELDANIGVFEFRFTGIYNNPNSLAIMFGLQIIIIIITYTNNKKIYSFLNIALSLLGLALTASRASILLTLCFLSLLFIKRLSIKKLTFLIILTITILLYFQYNSDALVFERISDHTLSGREEIWNDAIEKIKLNPYFGLGPAHYTYQLPNGSLISAHNHFINLAANTGIFTTAILIIFILINVFYAWNLRKLDIKYYLIGAFIISLIFHQFFETGGFTLYTLSGYIFFVLISYIRNHEHA